MNALVQKVERGFVKPSSQVPDFRAGDTVRVAVRIVEGDKERIQNFEGVCIARQGKGMSETFTVRRISFGVGMERVFLLNAPRIESVKVMRQGRVRRAKLYYLRELSGKKARIAESHRKRTPKKELIEAETASAPITETVAEASAEAPAAETQSE